MRQEDFEFEASLDYIVRPSLKKKKKKKEVIPELSISKSTKEKAM
jgi:hypothetical protein